MTFKILIRNVKKDYRDYGIFIITMMICSAVYYAFFSITSKWYNPDISVVFDLSRFNGIIRYSMAAVSLISIFLVKHVTGYLSLRKQKEFGLQNLMGLNKKKVCSLFFNEIVILGTIATLLGIILGGLLAQFINFFLIKTFDGNSTFIFPYYPDTIFYTLIFFIAIFIVVGKFESYKLKKKKIIDMIYAEDREQTKNRDRTIKIFHILTFIVNCWLTYSGYFTLKGFYDSRIPFIGKFLYISLFLIPLCYVVTLVVMKLLKKSDYIISKALVVFEFILAFLNILYVYGLMEINLPGDTKTSFGYIVRSGIYVGFLIFHYFYIYKFKGKDSSWESIFLKGQISSKLNRHRNVFSLISLVIYSSVLIFIILPMITGWSEGYLNSRMTQDVQVVGTYKSTTSEDKIYKDDFKVVFNYLDKEDISIKEYVVLDTYLPKKSDFKRRLRYDFPIETLKLSEYNKLLQINGYEPIKLGSGEYAVQVKHNLDKSDFDEKIFQGLETDFGEFKLKKGGVYDFLIPEYIYNAHVQALYILNDVDVENLTFVGSSLYMDLTEELDFKRAEELEGLFNEEYEIVKDGLAQFIRIRTLEKNTITTTVFLMKLILNYLAIILLLISFTIIALIELEDSLYNKKRYTTLWQLGISKTKIQKLTSKQLLFSFWRPLIISVTGALIIGLMYMFSIKTVIKSYVGAEIFGSIAFVLFIILILFLIYYLLTYYMFLANLNRRDN
ncbi:putative ABC transport system permease protein [Anaerosphaera aminiphila DSM 21120]|uniref:Putative ABC transport system permease protein n=1 Tax=Anaerosphaera aminiphila DSM 21120 TaxID=1120995 RepID=A0A1M5PPZ8_9FIRM|nr:FtsX-like permease family protein [Anaerosphaera aminiphila]SHH03353.1 putative ABC transport system permease protein [Anaerosphaera aminiphila DSM 21120]